MQPALLRGPQRALGAAEETPRVVYSLYASHGRTDARRLLSSRHLTLPLCSSPSPGWKGLLCCFEGHGLHSVRDRDRSDLCPPGLVSSRTEPGFFFRLFFFFPGKPRPETSQLWSLSRGMLVRGSWLLHTLGGTHSSLLRTGKGSCTKALPSLSVSHVPACIIITTVAKSLMVWLERMLEVSCDLWSANSGFTVLCAHTSPEGYFGFCDHVPLTNLSSLTPVPCCRAESTRLSPRAGTLQLYLTSFPPGKGCFGAEMLLLHPKVRDGT